MVGGERPLVPEILGQTDPVLSKTPIFNGALISKKSATKFLCLKTVGSKVVRENWPKTDPTPPKKPILNQYSLVSPQPKHVQTLMGN